MRTTRKLLLFSVLFLICFTSCKQKPELKNYYPINPVSFTNVDISDSFWTDRLETNRNVTIPYVFKKCEETRRIHNFAVAGGLEKGTFQGENAYNDSDVFKLIEAAAYSLRIHEDKDFQDNLDKMIAKVVAAQEEDGYLYTARTINPNPPIRWVEKERWSNLYMGHELYNMGHFYEAATAHYLATGKSTLFDVALKNADLIAEVFGPGKKIGVPGHQAIEIGLVKLFRVTGNQKYLDLAKFFLDERGKPGNRELYGQYSQDHKPVLEQQEAVGHAVRAAYMYAGMADIAALLGDKPYIAAIDKIWKDVVGSKLYITGGIGATESGGAFGKSYELPNDKAYAETSAAIANVFWNHRMFLLHGESKYIDVLERVLYNGLISGVSYSGDRFFCTNPLEASGNHERSPWSNDASCPSNIVRFIPSLSGYIYATEYKTIFVNLFIQSNVEIPMGRNIIRIEQITQYPWKGNVLLKIKPAKRGRLCVKIRIPGWAVNQPVPSDLYRFMDKKTENITIKVNGQPFKYTIDNGYADVTRLWRKGDTVELELPMPIRRALSHENVEANLGRVAIQRGPLVYCAEGIENNGNISDLILKDDMELLLEDFEIEKRSLPRIRVKDNSLTLIPYFAWALRDKGTMAVWLPREKK